MKNREPEYKIKIDEKSFKTIDPLIDGREILNIAGKGPSKNFVIMQLLKTGQLEDVRLDEKIDLREKGRETFITFESDRIYRFKLNDRVFSWGSSHIDGRWLFKLAGLKPTETTLWLISIGGEDSEIQPTTRVSLKDQDVECFQTQKKYTICIEGQTYPWPASTIQAKQIAELGNWDENQGIIEIDQNQNERTLESNEVVSLSRGLSYCKKQRFKRGLNEDSRIAEELKLLQQFYPLVVYKKEGNSHWFYIEGLALDDSLSPNKVRVCFNVSVGHPVSKPYGFFVQSEIKKNGVLLNFQSPPNPPPFEGTWGFKSWDAPHWNPKSDVLRGDNLWGWVRSFREGIAEGP